MKRTIITLEEAIGKQLAHDLTQIDAKAGTKGARFRKGHVVSEEDLPTLRNMGRDNLSILEMEEGDVHENDAAIRLSSVLCGDNLTVTPPSEGRCNLIASCDGFLDYDADVIHRINEDLDWVVSTLSPHRSVRKGQVVAGFRIRPIVMDEARVQRAVDSARAICVRSFKPLKVGLVTTGKEIAEGRVEDAFADKFRGKLETFKGELIGQRFCTDDASLIAEAIRAFLNEGAQLVVCTGGMSVDADDRTPGAIREVATRVAFQGVPVLPGAMALLGWVEQEGEAPRALIGAPACVVHDERTVLDRLLPYVFARVDPGNSIRRWGVGGLCEQCPTCHWPACSFAANE